MLRLSARQIRVAAPRRLFATAVDQPAESHIPAPRTASELPDQPTPEQLQQAPNRQNTWAPSQRPRADAMTGPRFVQHDLDRQPRPYAAIELIAKHPIRYLHDHSAVCDGGKGAQGHPKIYINLDKPGAHACQYCGTRFAQEQFKADIEAGKLSGLVRTD